MSGKKPSLLRSALKEMRVNEPVRLSKNAPSFKPPASDEKEAPPREVPLSEVPALDAPQDELPHDKVARNEVPPAKVTENEVPRNELPTCETTQPERSQSKVPQNEMTNSVETRSELPQIEEPEDRISDSAFFKLSHRVFAEPKLQKMSGDCFRLFLWMAAKAWRYPNSEGTVRAAIRYIEEATGMSHANVSRCLKTLKEQDLVRLVQTDFKRGNVWWVSPLACPSGGPGGRGLPKKEAAQFEVAQDRNEATSKSDRSSHKMRSEGPRFEGEIKKLRKQKNLKEAAAILNPHNSMAAAPSNDEFEDAVQLFETSETEETQEIALKEFVARELPHGFLPPNRVLYRLVAYDWYKNRRESGFSKIAVNG